MNTAMNSTNGINHNSMHAPNQGGNSPDGSEPVQQLRDRGIHGDNESHAETAEQRGIVLPEGAPQAQLPRWIAEKYHWVSNSDGSRRLNPNPDFLMAVKTDTSKFVKYGETLCEVDSTEYVAARDISSSLAMTCESLSGFDTSEREQKALRRFVTERACAGFVYAAVTQFEIDNWAASAAAQHRNASDHQNFGEKQSRRDEFALSGYVWLLAGKLAWSDFNIDELTLERQGRGIIYQQARMRTQEFTAPKEVSSEEQQSRAAAIAVSRPI